MPNFDRIISEVIDLGHRLASKRLSNLNKFEEFYQQWKYPLAYKRTSSENFSLIIERITGDVDVIVDGDEQTISPKKSIDWKMAFYDEFIRYADRFYLTKKTTTSQRRIIGGERFLLSKWSSNKLNYFHTKNIVKRNSNSEYEKQIEQLYI